MTMNLGFSAAMISRATLRPLGITARVIADKAGIGAMFAHDADLGVIGVCIFKPVGEPVRVRISHDNDLDCGILARRGWRRARVIGGLLVPAPRPFSLPRISRGFPWRSPQKPPGRSPQKPPPKGLYSC